jgi:hypothetical protein
MGTSNVRLLNTSGRRGTGDTSSESFLKRVGTPGTHPRKPHVSGPSGVPAGVPDGPYRAVHSRYSSAHSRAETVFRPCRRKPPLRCVLGGSSAAPLRTVLTPTTSRTCAPRVPLGRSSTPAGGDLRATTACAESLSPGSWDGRGCGARRRGRSWQPHVAVNRGNSRRTSSVSSPGCAVT